MFDKMMGEGDEAVDQNKHKYEAVEEEAVANCL